MIECGSCRARYRIKASMLKGFKGAEVRCRKCGEMIVVLTPGSDSQTPVPGAIAERKAASRRPFPASGKTDRAFGTKTVSPLRTAQGPEQREARALAGMAVPEESGPVESVRDNVYQFDLFRGVPPEEPPAAPYDISGIIQTDPPVSPAKKGPPAASPRPADIADIPERKDPGGPIFPEEPIAWGNEGVTALSTETPFPSLGIPDDPEESSSSRRTRFQSNASFSAAPRPSHVAIVYLLLLLLGGCGYLLVRFLAKIAGGGL